MAGNNIFITAKNKLLKYRIIQGDARKGLTKISDNSINQIITSPPYYKHRQYGKLEGEIGTKGTIQQYIEDLSIIFKQCYRILKNTGLFCLNIDNPTRSVGYLEYSSGSYLSILKDIGFKHIQTIIWYDPTRIPITSSKLLKHNYESIFLLSKTLDYTFNKDDIRVPYQRLKDWGDRTWKYHPKGADVGDVWKIIHHRGDMVQKGDKYDRLGIATFPVKLVERLVKLGSNKYDTILDPFLGSGTTMDVAKRLKRSCIGIEINPQYCNVAKERCFKPSLDNLEYEFKYEIV